MPIDKPTEYTIKASDLVVGDQIVIEQRVKKPLKGAPKTWWLMGKIVKTDHSKVFMLTLAESITWVDLTVDVVFRKPWADELVRNLIQKVKQKKRLKLKLPKGLAGEIRRLKMRNGDLPLNEWR